MPDPSPPVAVIGESVLYTSAKGRVMAATVRALAPDGAADLDVFDRPGAATLRRGVAYSPAGAHRMTWRRRSDVVVDSHRFGDARVAARGRSRATPPQHGGGPGPGGPPRGVVRAVVREFGRPYREREGDD